MGVTGGQFAHEGHGNEADRQPDVTTRRRSTIKVEAKAKLPLTWEPASGFGPMACSLQRVRSRAPSALAAPMARVIALTALVALGLSEASFHESFHAQGPHFG